MISWQRYEEHDKMKAYTEREQQPKNERERKLEYGWFDAMDNCGKDPEPRSIIDTSPAARNRHKRGKKGKP